MYSCIFVYMYIYSCRSMYIVFTNIHADTYIYIYIYICSRKLVDNIAGILK